MRIFLCHCDQVCLQPDGWCSFVKLPHAQHISLPRFTVTLTTKTNRKRHPLEDFPTNASPRTSETVTEIRLSYLRVEAFQFSLRVIPTIGGRIFDISRFSHLERIQSFKFYFSAVQFDSSQTPDHKSSCKYNSLYSFPTKFILPSDTSFLPSPAIICQIYSLLPIQLVKCHWLYEWLVH